MATKKEKFVQVMKDIANDNSRGYSQIHRWPSEGRDFDCSSLVYWAAHEAGYNVTLGPAGTHYTGTIIADFTKAGFRCDAFDGNLNDLEAGDILLNVSNHVAVYVGNGKLAEASCDENGGITGPKQGDQTGREIYIHGVYNYPWTHVLTPPAEKASTATKTTTTAAKSSSTLNGIDVSSNQPADICSRVGYDFAIVKLTGNPQQYAWNYVNPYAKQQAGDSYAKTGCVGLYHFTWGKSDPNTEADFFVSEAKKLGYLGKAVLVIDYEAQAVNLGRNWIKRFADRVKAQAGYAPVIYASGSVIVSQNLTGLGYPLWCANYYRGYDRVDGYTYDKSKIYAGCEVSCLWQYTSQGYLSGYSGALDLNVYFGSKNDWLKLAGGNGGGGTTVTDEDVKRIAKETAQQVLWGWYEVNGSKQWTLGGAVSNIAKDVWNEPVSGTKARDRLYGIDCAANETKTFAQKILALLTK